MLKKSKVVMLATNQKAQIHVEPKSGLMYKSVESFIQASQAYKSFHLYIVSDEEIKDLNWYFDEGCYKSNLNPIRVYNGQMLSINDKKIIASTDSSLTIQHHPKGQQMYLLPQPSQAFIDRFVEKYNSRNPISDVLVEYELDEDLGLKQIQSNSPQSMPSAYVPKVNAKDNTITIKPIKENFSRKETVKFAIDFANHCMKQANLNVDCIGEMLTFESNLD